MKPTSACMMKDVANTLLGNGMRIIQNGRRRCIDLILLMASGGTSCAEDGSGTYWVLPISSLDKIQQIKKSLPAAAFCRFNANARTEQILVSAILALLTGNGRDVQT
jgi:hypothetical protein